MPSPHSPSSLVEMTPQISEGEALQKTSALWKQGNYAPPAAWPAPPAVAVLSSGPGTWEPTHSLVLCIQDT